MPIALDHGDHSLDDHHILLALVHAKAGVIPRLLIELNIAPSDIETAIATPP